MTRTNCKHTSSNLPLTFTYWKNHLTFFRFSIVSVYLNTGKSPVRTFNNEVNGEIMPRREKNTWILFLIYFINYSGIHMIHSGWKVDDTSHDSLKDKKFLSASENSTHYYHFFAHLFTHLYITTCGLPLNWQF